MRLVKMEDFGSTHLCMCEGGKVLWCSGSKCSRGLSHHTFVYNSPLMCGSHTTALLQENKESPVKVGVANDWICVENEMNETWQVPVKLEYIIKITNTLLALELPQNKHNLIVSNSRRTGCCNDSKCTPIVFGIGTLYIKNCRILWMHN